MLQEGEKTLTIEDLKNLRDCHAEIKSLQGRITRLRDYLSSPPSSRLSHLPRGGGGPRDTLGDGMATLADMEEELQERIAELELKIRRVEGEIDALPPRERSVVRARYVDGYSWRKVGKVVGYTEDHCKRIDGWVRQSIG